MMTKWQLVFFAAYFWISPHFSHAASKPNIIFILVDDMPWWGTSVPQKENDPRSTSAFRVTPHVERLAQKGMTFSNAYAAAGMCAPSRTSIQTGLSPARHLFSGNSNFGESSSSEVTYEVKRKNRAAYLVEPSPLGSLNPKFMTIGEKLQEQGYATAHLGKWHVYGGGPSLHGYDVHNGETSNEEGKPTSGIEPDDPKRIFSMTKEGMEFITNQHKANKPFYVQLSHYVEHNKQMSLENTLAEFEKIEAVAAIGEGKNFKEASTHGAAVKDLDTSVGMLLDHLEKLGITDRTYVVFTSDNGKDLYNGKDSILRGDKWWLWEAGIRVPFIVAGPDIPGATYSSHNIVNYDLLPTFYEMAGGDPASLGDQVDGKSLLPLFRNQDSSSFEDRSVYFHYPHLRNSTAHSAVIKGDYKLYTFYEIPDKPQLFNLSEDLGETDNLASKMPEKAQLLLADLQGYLDRVGAYLPKVNDNADTSKPRFNPDKDAPTIAQRLSQQSDSLEGSKDKKKNKKKKQQEG